MLAVPPLVPLIHRELHLDEKSVGALVSGPVLLLAIAAVPGSLLTAKLGIPGAVIGLRRGSGIGLVAPVRAAGGWLRAQWWPDGRRQQAARIGLVVGMASATYFGANAYLPDFLEQSGRHDLISPTLAVLNGSQLLTAPAVALWPNLLTGRGGFIGSAALMAIAQTGIVFTPGLGVVPWAFVIGFATAAASRA